jgi:hypothetical protein
MAIINVSAGDEAVLSIGDSAANANVSAGTGLTVPYIQDITVNNSTGVFRWKTLDNTAESAVTTPATNQLSLNLVVDTDAFFGSSNADLVVNDGIYGCSTNKRRVYFRVHFDGTDTGSKYISGSGFISGLAPTTNMDAPVWVTPVTIEVDGDYSSVGTI